MGFDIDQTVQVKAGLKDEEMGIYLASWSGRIIEMYPEYGTVEVEWNSTTLQQIPDSYLRHCIDGGYDYYRYTIEFANLETIEPKDTPEQVQEMQEELEARYHDYQLYGEPPIPFSEVDRESFTSELLLPQSYTGWLEYLEKNLIFPFRAKVVEGSRHIGQKLDILALDGYEDPYGVIGVIKWAEEGAGNFILCDLEATDKDSANYHTLRKYVVWFANH